MSKENDAVFIFGLLLGGVVMGGATQQLINLMQNGPHIQEWMVDERKNRFSAQFNLKKYAFISSNKSHLTESFIDRYTIVDFSVNTLTIKGIDDQALEEATELIRKSCTVQQMIDVDLPTGRERLVFVTDKSCLDQLGK